MRAWICTSTPPCEGACIAARVPDLAGLHVGTSDVYRVRIVTASPSDVRVHMRLDIGDESTVSLDT